MTEIIYETTSIDKIITVFAIECAIVFGFIFITLFCCTGRCFDSKKSNDKNNFIFKKYSSQFKLADKTIGNLFLKDKKINTDKSNLSYWFNWFNWFNKCINTKETNQSDLQVNKLDQIDLEMGLGSNVETNIDIETKKEVDIEHKENQENEIDIITKKEVDIEHKENKENEIDIKTKKEVDTETKNNQTNNLKKNKIYIVYEFNNLDKISKPSRYMESEELDEFDELEEFVNIIIRSFKDKYDQIGIILKISSPGGSAFKFEHAYLNLIRLCDKKIELIGLVDKMAASGGYMLAMGCDKIISSKYAIIGSVGVIAQLYNWSELNKKVGLEEKTFTTGSHKNPFPMGSTYTEEDVERMGEMIDETFCVFKDIVFGGSRKFTQEQIEQITKAKTFHGFQAIQMGMVDQIQMSLEYLDQLDLEGHNIWICKKETEPKSILNSLLFGNVKYLIGGIKTMFENNIIENKVNKIKLI
jgi:signal peptide peptidase SppA